MYSKKTQLDRDDFIRKSWQAVSDHITEDDFTAVKLGELLGMSRSSLARAVKAFTGFSTNEFIRYVRLRRAAVLLTEKDLAIKEIVFLVGLKDIKYFRAVFQKHFGMNPSMYIRLYRKEFDREHVLDVINQLEKVRP
jgi:AraC-like DNA-binding protein